MRLALVFASVAVPALWSTVAHAQTDPFDDPYDLPIAPRPPTLPELTHPEIEGTLETTEGALIPQTGGVWTHAYVQRFDVEVPLALRRWYVGMSYALAAGGTGNAFDTVGGNLAIDGRTVWATRTGLTYGGGLSLLLPTTTFSGELSPTGVSTTGAVVARNAATLRPWDVTYFIPGNLGVRPYVDVRALIGSFIAQFRQGLDLAVQPSNIGNRTLYAMTGVYFGWRATPEVAVGFDFFQEYAILVPGVLDGARSAIVVSPSLRLSLPWVQPAISAFTNIGPPLYGANESFWGFKLAFTVVYDPTATLKLRSK